MNMRMKKLGGVCRLCRSRCDLGVTGHCWCSGTLNANDLGVVLLEVLSN